MIRILHVLSAMERAGTETLLMNLYRHIDRSKIQFDFAVSSTNKAAYDDEIIAMGGRIFHYPRYRGKNHFAYKKWWNEFLTKHNEYKIVHGHIGSTAAIYLNVAKKHGCYTIAHSHSTYGKPDVQQILYRIYSYPTRFVADHFFGCSMPALECRYGKKVAHNADKAQILHNAIDTKKFRYNPETRRQIRNNLSIKADDFVVGTVGRLTSPKNPYFTLKIIAELSKKILHFKFLWVGTGELEDDIKRIVIESKLTDKVIFTGSVPNANEMYQAMDVFIFPSLWEGLGNVAIEAQAAGLPTLCSEAVPNDAKVSDTIYYLPLHDTQKWCELITFQIQQQNLENRKNAYKQVANNGYDIRNVTSNLERFYLKKSEIN